MKPMIFVFLLLSGATQAHAMSTKPIDPNPPAQGLDLLSQGDASETPYQKIKNLYDQATPMQLSQFPTAEDEHLNRWSCAGAKEDTTKEQITALTHALVHVTALTVLAPAVPSSGPLFPATPEKDEIDDMIVIYDYSQGDLASPQQFGDQYKKFKPELSSSPYVVQSELADANDPSTRVVQGYRTINGLIVLQQTSANAKVMATLFDYLYCWKN